MFFTIDDDGANKLSISSLAKAGTRAKGSKDGAQEERESC